MKEMEEEEAKDKENKEEQTRKRQAHVILYPMLSRSQTLAVQWNTTTPR